MLKEYKPAALYVLHGDHIWSAVKQWILKDYMYIHIIFLIILETKVKVHMFKSWLTKSKIK